MARPITMADLAQKLGCNTSTVSRALRNDPSVSEKRRREVKELAEKLGYRPDPIVSAFTARVRTYRRNKGHGIIALVRVGEPREIKSEGAFSAGMSAEAETHGFEMQDFHLAELGHDPKGLERVLRTRAIQAVIVMPLGWDQNLDGMSFDNLACAQVGPSLKSPVLPMASTHFFENAKLACAKLWEAGHRGIGLVTNRRLENRLEHGWLGGYLAFQAMHMPKPIPPHFWENSDVPALRNWLQEHNITAVLEVGLGFIPPEFLEEASRNLERPPEVATLAGNAETPSQGINERNDLVGAAAVRLVVGQLHSGQMGPRQAKEKVLIPGIWRPAPGP